MSTVRYKIPWRSKRVAKDLARLPNAKFAAKWEVSIPSICNWRRVLQIPSPRYLGINPKALPIPIDFEEQWEVSTIDELAEYYGVSSSTVSAWARLRGRTRRGDKAAAWDEVLRWAREVDCPAHALAQFLDVSLSELHRVCKQRGVRLKRVKPVSANEVRTVACRVLRACGWTYEEVATAMGITRQRAHQIIMREH